MGTTLSNLSLSFVSTTYNIIKFFSQMVSVWPLVSSKNNYQVVWEFYITVIVLKTSLEKIRNFLVIQLIGYVHIMYISCSCYDESMGMIICRYTDYSNHVQIVVFCNLSNMPFVDLRSESVTGYIYFVE